MTQPVCQIVVLICVRKVFVHKIQQGSVLGYQLGRCERLLSVSGVEIQDWKMTDCTLGCLSESALSCLGDFISLLLNRKKLPAVKFGMFQYSLFCKINCCTDNTM